jgi:hypothetical protein
MRWFGYSLWALALVACGQNPQTGDGGSTPLDVVAGWSGSPTMNPGISCLSCHSADFAGCGAANNPCPAASYKPWSIAGTVYSSPDAGPNDGQPNVEILITDGNGKELTLVSNSAGNFYTEEALAFPLKSLMVQNKTNRMQMDLTNAYIPPAPGQVADCNSCHSAPYPSFSAPGRLFVAP